MWSWISILTRTSTRAPRANDSSRFSPRVRPRCRRGYSKASSSGFPSTHHRAERSNADVIGSWIGRLRGRGIVPAAVPRITSAVVERALADAANLLKTSGPVSAVDRAHTALHGWLKAACVEAAIPLTSDPNINEVFSALREKHPKLQITGPRAEEITKILRALSKILDSLNTLRNRASVAHPNEQLLDESEAMLVINTAQTLLHFLDAKLRV
jgi:Abortive infection C-terminus/HEPN domain